LFDWSLDVSVAELYDIEASCPRRRLADRGAGKRSGWYRYLPFDRCAGSERLGVPLSQAYSVATFYHSFSLKPKGKHCLHVCMGTACHVRGSPQVLDRLQTKLGVKPGGTTRDRMFTLETVNCLGACALGPMLCRWRILWADDRAQGVINC
jgi:hypothetical protein